MQPNALLTELVGRLAYLKKICTAVLELYERTGAKHDRVRTSEVSAAVCGKVRRENSPAFRADVIQAMKAVEWPCVKTGGVRQWKGVRRR